MYSRHWQVDRKCSENNTSYFSESTESVEPAEEDSQPKQMTLDEWKKMEDAKRLKSQFKLRRAGEGVDSSQWKTGREYRKSEGDEESVEEEEESDEEEVKLVNSPLMKKGDLTQASMQAHQNLHMMYGKVIKNIGTSCSSLGI